MQTFDLESILVAKPLFGTVSGLQISTPTICRHCQMPEHRRKIRESSPKLDPGFRVEPAQLKRRLKSPKSEGKRFSFIFCAFLDECNTLGKQPTSSPQKVYPLWTAAENRLEPG